MEDKYSQIKGAGLGLAAVSYDSPAVLKAFADRMHIEFPLLSDEDSAIIRRFGILNEEVKKDTPTYGIPRPGIYVLDARGVVKAKFFEDDYRQRDTAGMILLQQFGITPPKVHEQVKAKHLTLNASVTEANPHMGQHVSVILEVELAHGVHVYAPGVKGYIPIDWEMPETAAIKVGAVSYPTSKEMRLEAIKETVPVYAGRFRMTRSVTLTNDKDVAPLLDGLGNLTVTGSFRYQACDEEKCFLPETVPVHLILHFQTLDRTRVPETMRRTAPK